MTVDMSYSQWINWALSIICAEAGGGALAIINAAGTCCRGLIVMLPTPHVRVDANAFVNSSPLVCDHSVTASHRVRTGSDRRQRLGGARGGKKSGAKSANHMF